MVDTKPFDFVNSSINKNVLVLLKGNTKIRGKLKAFDVHLNLVLEDAEKLTENETIELKLGRTIIRGDTILLVSL